MKTFYKKLLMLSIPIMIQQFIQAALNLVDTIMIGKLGADEIAAVGIANQVFFFVMMIIFGINSGVSVYIAQFWGRKDEKNIRKTMGVSLTFGTAVGVIFCVIAVVFSEQLVSLFVDKDAVITLGVKYLRIVAFSYVFFAVSLSFQVASRGIGQTTQPMLVSAIALSINTVLNYLLIFGHLGLPAMGVEGAAIATLIARIFEFILMLILLYGRGSVLAASLSDLFSFKLQFVLKIFEKAGPVLMNEIFWCLGTIMYMWTVGKINSDAVASYQIAGSIYRFYEVIFVGLASAAGVMVGNSIGAGKENEATLVANRLVKLSFRLSLFISGFMFILSPIFLKQFNVNVSVLKDAHQIMNIYCVYGIARVFNLMMIVGILRGGGDTKYAMGMEILIVWLVGVPLAITGSLILKLSVVYVVLMLLTDELVKTIVGYRRLKSNKWVHNIISEIN